MIIFRSGTAPHVRRNGVATNMKDEEDKTYEELEYEELVEKVEFIRDMMREDGENV
jgi:hypothetical protein